MIPKIIHYCWLSNNPIPEDMKTWMNSWKKLHGYEFMLWNFNRFDINSSIWVKQAFEAKKYAFAADYIRAYALYHYGGIYMDMDVEVLKSFDELLDDDYLLAYESPLGIEGGILGSAKGCPIFKKILDYYKDKAFINEDGSFNTNPALPGIISKILKDNYQIKNDYQNKKPFDGKTVYIYPWFYFTSRNYPHRAIETRSESFTIHHFAGSWYKEAKWKSLIKTMIGKRLTNIIISFKHIFDSNKNYSKK